MTIEDLRAELFRLANPQFNDKYGISAAELALEVLSSFINDIDVSSAIKEIKQDIIVALANDRYQEGYDDGKEVGYEEGYDKAEAEEELRK